MKLQAAAILSAFAMLASAVPLEPIGGGITFTLISPTATTISSPPPKATVPPGFWCCCCRHFTRRPGLPIIEKDLGRVCPMSSNIACGGVDGYDDSVCRNIACLD